MAWTIRYLTPAVVVRQGDWCYQRGAASYRLGYVSGAFTCFERDFRAEIHARAGDPPEISPLGFVPCQGALGITTRDAPAALFLRPPEGSILSNGPGRLRFSELY